MIVIVKLDLDRYSLQQIEKLVISGVITMSEAQQSAAFLRLDDYGRLVWKRGVLAVMKDGVVAA